MGGGDGKEVVSSSINLLIETKPVITSKSLKLPFVKSLLESRLLH